MRRPSRRALAADAILLAALCAAALKLTRGTRSWMDLSLVDESGYLELGLGIPGEGLPHASLGALYGLWYQGLSLFQPDPIVKFRPEDQVPRACRQLSIFKEVVIPRHPDQHDGNPFTQHSSPDGEGLRSGFNHLNVFSGRHHVPRNHEQEHSQDESPNGQ